MVESGIKCFELRGLMKKYTCLDYLSLFKDIPAAENNSLLDRMAVSEKEVPAGGTILFQGSYYNHLHLLVDSSAFAEVGDVSGKSIQIESFDAPAVRTAGV